MPDVVPWTAQVDGRAPSGAGVPRRSVGDSIGSVRDGADGAERPAVRFRGTQHAAAMVETSKAAAGLAEQRISQR